MPRPFTRQVPAREPAQFVMDERHEPVKRSRFPAAPGEQKLSWIRQLVGNARAHPQL